MRGWWQDLTDLVLPAECGGCGRPRTVLCPECRAVLNGAAPSRVRPVPEPPGLPVVHASARYADAVRAMLLAHKERGALGLAGPLGTALAGAVWVGVREVRGSGGGERRSCEAGGLGGRAPARVAGVPGQALTRAGDVRSGLVGGAGLNGPVLLVPVPSARRAVRARGHDPARRIALAAAGELRRAGMPARVAAVLRQRRGVADQSGLNSRQRLENLAGALTVVPGGGRLLAEGLVVLVDDLMTTGASLTEAARAVREARERETVGHRGEQKPAGHRDQQRQERAVAGRGGEAAGVVYAAATGEGMGERMTAVTEEDTGRDGRSVTAAGAGGVRDVICAAVVAASPDSFEINRN